VRFISFYEKSFDFAFSGCVKTFPGKEALEVPRAKLVKVASPLTMCFAAKTKTESISPDSNEKRKALNRSQKQRTQNTKPIFALWGFCDKELK